MSKFKHCPKCGNLAVYETMRYYCNTCGWTNLDDDTIDIAYKDDKSSTLSNLYPHKFTMPIDIHNPNPIDPELVNCLSMESFLQSLKIPDVFTQKYFCENYMGYVACKAKLTMPDWRKGQTLYWMGRAIDRHSEEYQELLTTAYNRLFDTNRYFRNIVLPHFKGYYLVHTMGCDDPHETVLTEKEYILQLNRLMEKVQKIYT